MAEGRVEGGEGVDGGGEGRGRGRSGWMLEE